MPQRVKRAPSETAVVVLVAAVQFVNILDFVMVMPLGTYFSESIGVPISRMGNIAGSYTLAAAIAGFIGSFFLDRFDRRKALTVAVLGLVVGTALGGAATGMKTMMFARIVAGLFGGPATSLAFSVVADVVPNERRGKALATVMTAFSAAQILGVTLSLWAADSFGWRVPFFVVAGIGVLVVLGASFLLPPLTGHLSAVSKSGSRLGNLRALFANPLVRMSYVMTALVMTAGFLVIPNIPAYLTQNLEYPRDQYKWLSFMGGIASLVVVQLVGRLVDRFGSFAVGTAGVVLISIVTYFGFVAYPAGFPITVLFVCFMSAMGVRNVSYNTLATKVPGPGERAQFMSIQSTIQHLSTSFGALLSSKLLFDVEGHKLGGVSRIAWLSIGVTALLPLLLFSVESRVRRRDLAKHRQPADPQTGLTGLGPGMPRPAETRDR